MDQKERLRAMMKQRLSDMSDSSYRTYCTKIASRLFLEEIWSRAKTVGITVSRDREVDTRHIIEEAWRLGKQVAVPKCIPNTREMDFRKFHSFSDLEVVYFGLYEPMEDKTESVSPAGIDLLIVPGLVYDQDGYRIGFGGGYYDRYLTAYHGRTISLCFHCQVVDKLPREHHDRPIDSLISDKTVYQF
jgi:5-formyltetrahydrofolate cyclo-ligase